MIRVRPRSIHPEAPLPAILRATATPINHSTSMNSFRVWQGHPFPLGATWDGEGTNFALFSEHAEKVELCLFDPAEPQSEIACRRLMERTDHVFHGYLPEVTP